MNTIKDISIIFTSIFFESLPFLLIGSLISASIETYISNDTLARLIPKNKILGSLVGVILGFFLPACDCAVIPVSKRLLKKKVPINVAISFMLASPIINPVVLLSTYYAFYQTNPQIFYGRLIYGVAISLLIGIIMGIIFGRKEVTINNSDEECSCHHCHCHHEHIHQCVEEDFADLQNYTKPKRNIKKDILSILEHTALDMFDVVKYLMLGALIASLTQVLLPRDILTLFYNNKILSIITLMLFAYLISLCSTSDSFVGKTLASTFNNNAVMAYLLLGPMIDIKNTFVLLGNYKKSFVITLISLIFICIFIFSLLVVKI